MMQFLMYFLGRQNKIGIARCDGAVGHAIKLGRGWLLYYYQSASFFYGLDTLGAVGTGTRKYYGTGLILFIGRKAKKESINSCVWRFILHLIGQFKLQAFNGH